ncbi:hypothetical protein Sjap_014262 [Stephania japonica]|uniref:Uncharacterized protein n=1 Tax=Stephania japonica TaxID=461633 RepID=A0AAP0P0S6_9MAGN
MRLLTGHQQQPSFAFHPTSVNAIPNTNTVLAEGCDPDRSVTWVHAWTLIHHPHHHGLNIITQVREYFNTSLTVTRILDTNNNSSSISTTTPPASSLSRCQNLWQSTLPNTIGKSVPGLVLAI